MALLGAGPSSAAATAVPSGTTATLPAADPTSSTTPAPEPTTTATETPTAPPTPTATATPTGNTDPTVWWWSVTPSTASVRLVWSSYRTSTVMVRRDDGTGTLTPTTGTVVYSGSGSSVVDTDVTPWTRYRYTLWADDGAGGWVSPRSTTTETAVQQVTGLTATLAGATSATITWRYPTDPGAAAVVVTRTDLRGPARTLYTGTGTTVVDTGLLPGVTYTYTAVAQDASGRRGAVSPAVGVTTKRTWSTTVVSPYAGWPGAMACATTTWCMSVDNTGAYQVMSGTTWSAPVRAFTAEEYPWGSSPVMGSLTCPAAGRCLAVRRGAVVEFSGGTWRSAGSPSTSWSSLDCPTTTYCIAIRRDGWWTARVGTTWRAPARIGSLRGVEWNDVACQAAARCFAIATGSSTYSNWRGTLTSSSWSTAYLGDYQQGNVASISCSASTCLALGDRARVTVSGTTWSLQHLSDQLDVVDYAVQLSCGTPSLCMSRNQGSVTRWSSTALQERTVLSAGIGDIAAVSCPRNSSVCFAVDNRGRFYRWTSTSHWAFVSTYAPTTGGVGRIGCRTATSCFFVDMNGWFVVWNGTAWTRTGKYFTQPALVECAGTNFCLAVDGVNKVYRVWTNGSWGPTKTMPLAAGDVSCASPTLCLAVDDRGRMSRFSGTSWWAPVASITDSVGTGPRISCAPGGPCMLLSSDGRYRQYAGSTLTATKALSSAFPAYGALLACGSASMCIAVADAGNWAQWNGSTWTAHPGDIRSYRLGTLTCPTAEHCVGAHIYSNDYSTPSWVMGEWSEGDSYAPDSTPGVPECPIVATCFIGGGTTVSRSS